jgi:hypothetical protein
MLGFAERGIPATLLPGPAACAAGLFQFCPTMPSFQPAEEPPTRLADQTRPCEVANALRPSFCVALPDPGLRADRVALVARREQVCAQIGLAEAPTFCVLVPSSATPDEVLERQTAVVLLRARLGSTFRQTRTGDLDLWTEDGLGDDVRRAVERIVRDDMGAVTAYFDRRFRDVPAVFVFASPASFRTALVKEFGYAPDLASQLTSQYGGLLVGDAETIVINGQNVLGGSRPTIFRHELTHLLAHQIAGPGLPLWFDEGLATVVADLDATEFDRERVIARSILNDDALGPIAFDERRSWVERNAALGGHAYAVTAEAVRVVIQGAAGPAGLTSLLESARNSSTLERAYATATGRSLSDFIARLPAELLASCRRSITVASPRSDGLVIWRTGGFGPQRRLAVTASGPATYTFEVTTDRYGVYTGTFGGPMPLGRYVVRISGSGLAPLDAAVVVGDPAAGATRVCAAQ